MTGCGRSVAFRSRLNSQQKPRSGVIQKSARFGGFGVGCRLVVVKAISSHECFALSTLAVVYRGSDLYNLLSDEKRLKIDGLNTNLVSMGCDPVPTYTRGQQER